MPTNGHTGQRSKVQRSGMDVALRMLCAMFATGDTELCGENWDRNKKLEQIPPVESSAGVLCYNSSKILTTVDFIKIKNIIMFTTITIGVLASIAAELVTWLNKQLTDTVLKGKAAFIIAAVIALVGAAIKVGVSGVPLTDIHTLGAVFTQIWAVSQAFFVFVVDTFHLDVKDVQE